VLCCHITLSHLLTLHVLCIFMSSLWMSVRIHTNKTCRPFSNLQKKLALHPVYNIPIVLNSHNTIYIRLLSKWQHHFHENKTKANKHAYTQITHPHTHIHTQFMVMNENKNFVCLFCFVFVNIHVHKIKWQKHVKVTIAILLFWNCLLCQNVTLASSQVAYKFLCRIDFKAMVPDFRQIFVLHFLHNNEKKY